MENGTTNTKFEPTTLATIQSALVKHGVKALLVRSTDQYFNEYVPKHLSARAKLTGFDGSVGDAIITTKAAHLFVDGRYSLQAKQQAKDFTIHVTDNAQSLESYWLKKLPELIKADDTLAYDSRTIDLTLFDRLSNVVAQQNALVDAKGETIINELMHTREDAQQTLKIFAIDEAICGMSSAEKIATIRASLAKDNIDAFLTVKLDDIAWLTNWRCYYFPFQSTLPAIACVFPTRILIGLKRGITYDARMVPEEITVVADDEFMQKVYEVLAKPNKILGIAPQETSKAHELALRESNIEIKRVHNPIAPLKAIKNEKELLHFRSAFKKADNAVYQTYNFIVESFEKGQTLTEADVDRSIREAFTCTGAQELSFRPICAGGKNGAIIHYGTPDHKEALHENSLFLLDTGAYYEGGYATDLTRTFLAGKKSAKALPWQKEMFTLVLKASIAGLSARIRRGTLGIALDALVRAPLFQRGLDFAHGTGHGVGINVHEFPPRIALTSFSELLPGHVFSIEPGLYFENVGGVRIENLATIVEDPEHPNFLRVLPLTFCPMDERLIENSMLDDFERSFLAYFKREWESDAPWPQLPPLSTVRFA